jgi:hypothetical protein
MSSAILAPVARVAAPTAAKQQQQQQQRRSSMPLKRISSNNNNRSVVTPKAFVDANAVVQLASGIEDSIPSIAIAASLVRSSAARGVCIPPHEEITTLIRSTPIAIGGLNFIQDKKRNDIHFVTLCSG